jgi:hypothetical protein
LSIVGRQHLSRQEAAMSHQPAGITLEPHVLLASTHVHAAPRSFRVFRPPVLNAQPALFTPLPAEPGGNGLFALNFRDGTDLAALSPEQPVRAQAASADAASVVVAYDDASGLYLPVGAGSHGDLRIATLPPQGIDQTRSRSIGGMLTMAAYKLAGNSGLVENPYPLLRSAHTEPDGTVRYDEDGIDALRARVAAAQRIAVLVHGFTGDSRGMVPAMSLLARQPGGPAPHDLVLAYDYENLNSRIQDSSVALGQRLAAIGLSAGHGKTVNLIAHSLGTQVSRWWIEREGGAGVVQKAVLLGPPNAGTPLAVLQDWLFYLVGLGLNGLLSAVAPWTILTWAVRALSAAVTGVEKIDTTLDQLKPNSDFYRDLNASPDPRIPYHVINGDTFQIAHAPIRTNDKAAALFQAVFSQRTRDRLMSLAFGNRPNDLAISQTSAESVAQLNRNPAPRVSVVACDHLTYFDAASPGLATLAQALA